MSRLAKALSEEFRRVSNEAAERRARPALRGVEKELLAVRRELRSQRSLLAAIERKLGSLQRSRGRGPGAPRIAPEDIRALRGAMPRVEFAKLVGVSPGSIFGWETGRTLPRGRSVARLLELQKQAGSRRRKAASGRRRRRG